MAQIDSQIGPQGAHIKIERKPMILFIPLTHHSFTQSNIFIKGSQQSVTEPQTSVLPNIHSRLLSLMRPNDDARTVITKKFLRAYTENELEKQSFAKELCTPKDMEMLTRAIQQRFSSIFKANGCIYKRNNKHFIYGIQLPKDLAAAEAKFKSNQQRLREKDGEQKLNPSRVTLVCDNEGGLKDEEDNANVFEEEEEDDKESQRAYSRVTNTKSNVLRESKARTDIGNRLKAAFHSSNKSPREHQLERKARELEDQNRELHSIVSYLMKRVVEMVDADRRLQQYRSIDAQQPVLSSRAKRQLRSLL